MRCLALVGSFQRSTMKNPSFLAVFSVLAISPACQPETEPRDGPDYRIKIKLGKSLQILPVGRAAGMMKMLRHPDGTLYLNTQSADLSRGLARSTDGGKNWTSHAPGSATFWSAPAMGERPGAIRPSFTHTPPRPITPSTPPDDQPVSAGSGGAFSRCQNTARSPNQGQSPTSVPCGHGFLGAS